MNVLSLFSGIGGLELGFERAGMTVVGQVEIDPYARSILARHWPEVPRHDDVHTTVQWWRSQSRPPVHAVIGGFPCQPASSLGLGLGPDDPRWLWPVMADIVSDLRPEWVVWENVSRLLHKGLHLVHADLVRLGYQHRVGWATACAVGAPHVRRRLFGLAHATGLRCEPGRGGGTQAPQVEPRRRGPQPGGPWTGQPRPVGVAYGVPTGVDRRRTLGNAVVPDVAEQIGRLILTAARDQQHAA